ncbi:MAG TPA: FtsX-like permease family protein, partial [Acidobacteriaceae bacterium]|nr:FtsX-like permease family protein [Acidobacteriaceae bacterium]
VPGARVSWKALQRAITEGSANAGGGSLSWRRLGSMLVIAEVAVSVVLLVGAGLLSRSLKNLLHTDLSFNPDKMVTLSVGLPSKKFPEDAQRVAMERQILDRVAAIPGVASAGYSDLLPVSFNGNTDWIRFPGRPYDGKHIEINARSASPTYFSTLQVPLLKGRFFNEQDTADKPLVAIVNRRFAESYFPGQDPIGKTFGDTSLTPKSMKTIVGVVDDLHEGALDDPIWPAAYYSAYQGENGMEVVLRVTGGDSSVIATLPSVLHSIDPDLSVAEIMTMNDRINNSQSATLRRGAAWLAGTFAGAALLLCAVGLYGVISYSVSLRTREIGVRMALGARRSTIYAAVLREASHLSLAGIVAGILLSVGSMSLLRSILFHVSSWDIPTLTGACVVLLLCAIVAALAPARRAARSDPTEALRSE